MRAFLEEYGRIIIIIVCVAALLGVVAIFKLKGISLADSSLGAFVRNANSAINELEDANAYSVRMPKSTTAEIKSSGGNLAKVEAGETITIGPGYTNSEQTITIASLSEQTPGNATAADILAGKTVWVNGVQITGTMPNKGNFTGDAITANSFPAGYYSGISVTKKGAATYVPGTTDQTIADNQFLTGVQTIKGDGNLVAANIAKGKTIFGITGTFGADTNATAADVLQGKTVYIDGQKVTGTLNPTNYSSDATATADKILQGWTAYVNGKKITGTIPSLPATTITPSATDQKISGGKYMAGDVTIKGDSNLKPENIRTGVSIYSVNGTYTSDATADASKIIAGYTAYVNGQKVTGTATAADFTQDGNATAKQILSGYTAYVKGQKITGTLTLKDFTNDATATAKDVLVGKTAYGKDGKITGTLTVRDLTSDATATPEQILNGITAYVKGEKIIGTIMTRTTYSVGEVIGDDNSGVSLGNYSIPATIKLGIGDSASFASGYYPDGFKVDNSVVNRSTLNVANAVAETTPSFPDGYYSASKVMEIYNAGVRNGSTTVNSGFAGATVTYYLVHQHVDGAGNIISQDGVYSTNQGGCFTRQSSYSVNVKVGEYRTPHCERVGDQYDCSSGECHWNYTGETVCNGYDTHEQWETRTYPCWYAACGKTYKQDEGSTTNYHAIKPTQLIRGVTIDMY